MSEKRLDAIHDTVHETARDEARHGNAFEDVCQRKGEQEIRIDLECLINNISDEEALPLGGGLSKDQQKRIENKILAAIICEKPKKKRHKKRMLLVLAAAIIAVFGITAGAAKGAWNFDLVDFSGIRVENIDALDGSQEEIGVSTTATLLDYSENTEGVEREVTFTITDSFGASQQQFVEITTDYPVPADFDPEKDVITPRDLHGETVVENSDDICWVAGNADVVVRDGMLVLRVDIQDDERPINNAAVTLYFEDLYICKDASIGLNGELNQDYRDGKPLLVGEWQLKWTNAYAANTYSAATDQTIVLGGVEVVVDDIHVSGLGIRWEGHAVKSELEEAEMAAIGNAMCPDYPYDEADTVTITCKDGSTIKVEHPSSAGVTRSGNVEYYVGIDSTGEVLDPDNVKSLSFQGVEITVQ